MILFRTIDFAFRLFSTIMLVMVLQISVSEKTLESHLLDFIRHSESTQPLREVTYSNIERLNLNVQVPKEQHKRILASTKDSSNESSPSSDNIGSAVSSLVKLAISPSLAGLNQVKQKQQDIKNLQKDIEAQQKDRMEQMKENLSEE